jgi:hypothetical protein
MDFFLNPMLDLLRAILKAIKGIPSHQPIIDAIDTAAAQAHQDAIVAEDQREAIAQLLEDIKLSLMPPPDVAGFAPTIDTIEKQ